MLLELHTHTSEQSACSRISALELLQFVMDQGVDGVVLTDHHYLWSDTELADLRIRAGIPDNFLLLSGQEVTTSDFGDVLVYGARESLPPYARLKELRRSCPAAALVWAHPYRWNRRPSTADFFNAAFDAIEVLNPHQSPAGNDAGLAAWQNWGFAATGGSDIHKAELAAFYPTAFTEQISSISQLVTAIMRGDCRPVQEYRCPGS